MSPRFVKIHLLPIVVECVDRDEADEVAEVAIDLEQTAKVETMNRKPRSPYLSADASTFTR